MKLSEIIFRDELIFTSLSLEENFTNLTTEQHNTTAETVLIITNSKNKIKIDTNNPPLAVICDLDADIPEELNSIRVANARLAASKAFSRFYQMDFSKTKIIGVTGTNGKTSTATFIKKILTHCGYKVGFIGTGKIEIDGRIVSDKNYSMTTPDPSLLYNLMKEMEKAECDFIVMEVSSHALALDKVAPVHFDYALFTNLSYEHMDFHGNIESYYQAKKRLFEQADVGIFNMDDDYAKRAYNECKARKIGVGILWRHDAWVTSLSNKGLKGIYYIYNQKNFSFQLNLKTAGTYNVYNSLLAATTCIDMGCKPCEVKEALEKIDSVPGRFEIINGEITVIIDYAHTETAFNNIMKDLNRIKEDKKLWVVFGCGGERDKHKRPAMAKTAEKYADNIIITTDNSRRENPKDIISDIIRGFKDASYEVNENREKAITKAILAAQEGDIVAIIGKGCEKYNIDKLGYHEFDERKIVETALTVRKESYN